MLHFVASCGCRGRGRCAVCGATVAVTATPGPALDTLVEQVGKGGIRKACVESAPASAI